MVLLQICRESRVVGGVNEPLFVPRINKKVSRPIHSPGFKVRGESERQQTIWLDIDFLIGDEYTISSGGDADANLGAGRFTLKRKTCGFEMLEQLESFGR